MELPERILSAKKPLRFVKELSIETIRRNELNPRQIFREKDINKLCDSILEMGGILVPLVVLEVAPNDFVLLDGERRLRAAKKLKMKTVPANVISGTMNDAENLSTMFSIHMARESWDPASRALALGKLRQLCPEVSIERLVEITGMTKSNILDAQRILTFPEDIIQRCLLEGSKNYLRPANLVEMAKAIEAIDKYLPDFFVKHNQEKFVRILIEKRDRRVIRKNTDFRLIGAMFEALSAEKVEGLLEKLLDRPEIGIAEIFQSVEYLIAARKFAAFVESCDGFLGMLDELRFQDLDGTLREQAFNNLSRVKKKIEDKIKLLEAR